MKKQWTRWGLKFGAALVILGVFTFVAVRQPSFAAFPGANGKIAFEATTDGNAEIYAMNPDGTDVTNVSQNPDYEGEPAWSPDGTKITFISLRDGNNEIYVMNADGSGQMRLTNNPAVDDVPSWSPDGTKIIFYSQRDGNDQIYTMNADGTNQTNVSNNANSESIGRFSPDGTRIVFQSSANIFVMNADGTNRTQLTFSGGNGSPAWSPDGSKIVFHNCPGNCQIVVMNSDGTGVTQLTFTGSNASPAWSPDGTKITFDSTRDGNYEVYVMNADGSGQVNITSNPAVDFRPDWQPVVSTTITVSVDIKPGSFPNSINPRSNGVIPVAILTTNTFDATSVNPLSIRFGPNSAAEAHGRGHIEDANGDGNLDLVLHFRTQDTGIQCGDTTASLTGATFGGQAIVGADSLKTTGCK